MSSPWTSATPCLRCRCVVAIYAVALVLDVVVPVVARIVHHGPLPPLVSAASIYLHYCCLCLCLFVVVVIAILPLESRPLSVQYGTHQT